MAVEVFLLATVACVLLGSPVDGQPWFGCGPYVNFDQKCKDLGGSCMHPIKCNTRGQYSLVGRCNDMGKQCCATNGELCVSLYKGFCTKDIYKCHMKKGHSLSSFMCTSQSGCCSPKKDRADELAEDYSFAQSYLPEWDGTFSEPYQPSLFSGGIQSASERLSNNVPPPRGSVAAEKYDFKPLPPSGSTAAHTYNPRLPSPPGSVAAQKYNSRLPSPPGSVAAQKNNPRLPNNSDGPGKDDMVEKPDQDKDDPKSPSSSILSQYIALGDYLRYIFLYKEYKPGQDEIIKALMRRQDDLTPQ